MSRNHYGRHTTIRVTLDETESRSGKAAFQVNAAALQSANSGLKSQFKCLRGVRFQSIV